VRCRRNEEHDIRPRHHQPTDGATPAGRWTTLINLISSAFNLQGSHELCPCAYVAAVSHFNGTKEPLVCMKKMSRRFDITKCRLTRLTGLWQICRSKLFSHSRAACYLLGVRCWGATPRCTSFRRALVPQRSPTVQRIRAHRVRGNRALNELQ
jgi:hypothetical protein